MISAEDRFHNAEVYYEAANRKLAEAAAMFATAAHHFTEAGGATGRRRAVEALDRAGQVTDMVTAAGLTIDGSRGYVPD